MIIVQVKNSGSIEQALKQYKFKVYKTKQIQKLQERQEYKKPSVVRRAKVKKAIYNQKNHSSDWSFDLSFDFLPKIASVDVRPRQPNANNPITSISESDGFIVPFESVFIKNTSTSEITHNNPDTLFDEMVPLPSLNKLFKKLFITLSLIF